MVTTLRYHEKFRHQVKASQNFFFTQLHYSLNQAQVQGTSWQATGHDLPDYLTAELGHTLFHTPVLEPQSRSQVSQPSDKLSWLQTVFQITSKTCMRFSTSSRNAQFPRLFPRAFRKWVNSKRILSAHSKLSNSSCAQPKHATTMRNCMESGALSSHTCAMSQTCSKLKENSNFKRELFQIASCLLLSNW